MLYQLSVMFVHNFSQARDLYFSLLSPLWTQVQIPPGPEPTCALGFLKSLPDHVGFSRKNNFLGFRIDKTILKLYQLVLHLTPKSLLIIWQLNSCQSKSLVYQLHGNHIHNSLIIVHFVFISYTLALIGQMDAYWQDAPGVFTILLAQYIFEDREAYILDRWFLGEKFCHCSNAWNLKGYSIVPIPWKMIDSQRSLKSLSQFCILSKKWRHLKCSFCSYHIQASNFRKIFFLKG